MGEFDLMTFLFQFVVVWIAFKLGQFSVIHNIAKDVVKELEEKGLVLDKDEEGNLSLNKTSNEEELQIERIGKNYYAYSDGNFLAQGDDFKNLFEYIKRSNPGKTYRVAKYQAELTEEESARMIRSIFEVFGDKDDSKSRKQVERD